jgi:hypothetical protein
MKGEEYLHSYLVNNIKLNIIEYAQLENDEKSVIDLNYFDLRNLLQKIYNNKITPKYKNSPSLLFHLIQNRRESLELLFYMSSILIKLNSEVSFWLLLYSNYTEHRTPKTIKTLYPEKNDLGLKKRGDYIFPKFNLASIYIIEFEKINKLIDEYLKNVLPHYYWFLHIDIFKYYINAIKKFNISPEIYRETLRNGYYKNNNGISYICDAITLLRDVEFIEESLDFLLQLIDSMPIRVKEDIEIKKQNKKVIISIPYMEEVNEYIKKAIENKTDQDTAKKDILLIMKNSLINNRKDDVKVDDNYFDVEKNLYPVKSILTEISKIPYKYDIIINILNKFQKHQSLKKIIDSSIKKQNRLGSLSLLMQH